MMLHILQHYPIYKERCEKKENTDLSLGYSTEHLESDGGRKRG